MKCPRCETTTLDEREREGIVIDVCSSCRGIWLDRGELEKLIARAARDYEEVAPPRGAAQYPPQYQAPQYPPQHPPPAYGQPPPPPYGHGSPPAHQRYDDDHYRRYPKRKKQWYEAFGDIFD